MLLNWAPGHREGDALGLLLRHARLRLDPGHRRQTLPRVQGEAEHEKEERQFPGTGCYTPGHTMCDFEVPRTLLCRWGKELE